MHVGLTFIHITSANSLFVPDNVSSLGIVLVIRGLSVSKFPLAVSIFLVTLFLMSMSSLSKNYIPMLVLFFKKKFSF
jgi:hypothetical protein